MTSALTHRLQIEIKLGKKKPMEYIYGELFFGGCLLRWVSKGIREKRVRKKNIHRRWRSRRRKSFIYNNSPFPFFPPLVGLFAPPKMTQTKKKKKMYRGERGTIALY